MESYAPTNTIVAYFIALKINAKINLNKRKGMKEDGRYLGRVVARAGSDAEGGVVVNIDELSLHPHIFSAIKYQLRTCMMRQRRKSRINNCHLIHRIWWHTCIDGYTSIGNSGSSNIIDNLFSAWDNNIASKC